MLPRHLCFAALLALPLASIACGGGSSNTVPIIDSVDAPLVVNEQNGAYTIPVTVLFHDGDGEAVTHVRYRLGATIEGTVNVPAANPTRESALVAIVITGSALDEEAAHTALTAADGKRAQADSDKATDDGHAHSRGRGEARSLQLTIVDERGAESLPQASTVTLD